MFTDTDRLPFELQPAMPGIVQQDEIAPYGKVN